MGRDEVAEAVPAPDAETVRRILAILGESTMTPAEYGVALAQLLPPITEEQVEETARVLATVDPD